MDDRVMEDRSWTLSWFVKTGCGMLPGLKAKLPVVILLGLNLFGDRSAFGMLVSGLVQDETTQAAEAAVAESSEVAEPAAKDPGTLSDDRLQQLIGQLHGGNFAERQQAIAELNAVSAAQISQLAQAAESQEDAEVARRLFELMEKFYSGNDAVMTAAASEALERAASSQRWMVAERAADVLDRQWRRRSRLTIAELQTLGARFNSVDLLQFAQGPGGRNRFFFQPINLSQLQIKLDRTWHGGERGIRLLERLAAVVTGGGPVGEIRSAIYLIDQHPLTEPEVVRLKTAFGDARVVPRGRVFLGISNSLFFGEGKGCRVGEVTEGTSAHDAGILPEDVIRSVDGIEIRDFDHLVQLLRDYDVGDRVKMKIERGASPYRQSDAPRDVQEEDAEPAEDAPPGALPGIRGSRLNGGRLLTITVLLKGW